MRHWVDNHFYDFERDELLLAKLREFLSNIKGKAMRKMADSIIKAVQRRQESSLTEREFTMQVKPPNIEWHLARKFEEAEIMAVSDIFHYTFFSLYIFSFFKERCLKIENCASGAVS